MTTSPITFKPNNDENRVLIDAFRGLCVEKNWTQAECLSELIKNYKQFSLQANDITRYRVKADLYDRLSEKYKQGYQNVDHYIETLEKQVSEAEAKIFNLESAEHAKQASTETLQQVTDLQGNKHDTCPSCKLLPMINDYAEHNRKYADAIFKLTQQIHLEKAGAVPLTREQALEKFFEFTQTLPDAE